MANYTKKDFALALLDAMRHSEEFEGKSGVNFQAKSFTYMVNVMFEVMEQILADGDELTFTGFMNITNTIIPEHEAIDRLHGNKKVTIPQKHRITAKISPTLRNRVNNYPENN